MGAPPTCGTGAILYPSSSPQPSVVMVIERQKENLRAAQKGFFLRALTFGHVSENRLWLPLQSKLSLKAAGH